MAVDLTHCEFLGPALPEPFVKFDLEGELNKLKLMPKGSDIQGKWDVYRRHLRELVSQGGPLRVRNKVIEPLMPFLGYDGIEPDETVETREGQEPGGCLLVTSDGKSHIRVWTTDLDTDLDAPSKRGWAYRFSHVRVAQRVLLAKGEKIGILTNGVELRILISEAARPDSQVIIPLDPDWKRSRNVPDSFRLLLALCCPKGTEAIPKLVDQARLKQTRVTKELRVQARQAVEMFVQEVLDHPENREKLETYQNKAKLAKDLWHEGLITIYRLLFILKGEASDDPARSFSFASTSLWRNTYSPGTALSRYVRRILDDGAETGCFLEEGLRNLFRMFDGSSPIQCTELNVKPLGGALFGPEATPILSDLRWGEYAVAHLLDRLLWTPKRKGSDARERVHYGPLDVEDLGRVYEALLELEPGISSEPMCRLRRQKLEVVVPVAQGEKYRAQKASGNGNADLDEDDDSEEETESNGKKTKVEWIEEIRPGEFYLRVGLGRKSTGSYYTPHSFVRFLVQETLGPQVEERSPKDDPKPVEILKLKVLDPAMGSGHFLVEACRVLGLALYESCRLCDEKMMEAEKRAEDAAEKNDEKAFEEASQEVAKWRERLTELPDPDDEILAYLPSRAPEGEESGLSSRKAEALCRRLVAVHCLYGVDKNPLAVELAKLTLWLESQSEGLPLTFLDHRLVVGDSLTGPFWEKLIFYPGSQKPVDDLYSRDIYNKVHAAISSAIDDVRYLGATIGVSLAEILDKKQRRERIERALAPFKILAAAWAGGVMLGPTECDDLAYAEALGIVGETGDLPQSIESSNLRKMIAVGLGVEAVPQSREDIYGVLCRDGAIPALPYDLTFPEVFYPTGVPYGRRGFNAVLGNPPWDRIRPFVKEFYAGFDIEVIAAPDARARDDAERRVSQEAGIEKAFRRYTEEFAAQGRVHDAVFHWQSVRVGDVWAGRGNADAYCLFAERATTLLCNGGRVGIVLPSAFHANEGATGIRQLYLDSLSLQCCYSFENRRKLFEIDSRFRFALVVAQSGEPTTRFRSAFYLHDDAWLFDAKSELQKLIYSRGFVRATGRDYLVFLELRSAKALEAAEKCYAVEQVFGDYCRRTSIQLGVQADMTRDRSRFTTTSSILPDGKDPRDPKVTQELSTRGCLVLHEGKTFWHYDDNWESRPTYCVRLADIPDRPGWTEEARYFRVAYRGIASVTNERTVILSMLPPGAIVGNSAPVERKPWAVSRHAVLAAVAVANAFTFDWTLRIRGGSNVNQFVLYACPFPAVLDHVFLRSSALRLTCNHEGYDPLWREQVRNAWREPGKEPFTWPVLATDDERWEVRAAVDAVVADAYGLNREQYEHVLSTFSHKSYPKAPKLCLAKFDELKEIGLEAFTRNYDPYWDIPLNENLPEPVIDLPIPAEKTDKGGQGRLEI